MQNKPIKKIQFGSFVSPSQPKPGASPGHNFACGAKQTHPKKFQFGSFVQKARPVILTSTPQD